MDFVRSELRAGRPFPSSDAIAQHMGWKHRTSANDALRNLCFYDKVLSRVNGAYQVRVG
jgi:hypothetical protein